jgi:hypothetical protein
MPSEPLRGREGDVPPAAGPSGRENEIVERDDGLYVKGRTPTFWMVSRLPNKRVMLGRSGALWRVRFKLLVSREKRKISLVDFCLSNEAMDAFIMLHLRHKLDERIQARSAPEPDRAEGPT